MKTKKIISIKKYKDQNYSKIENYQFLKKKRF